jgi:hypothetical protein
MLRLALLAGALASSATAATIFLSPSGNDATGDGSIGNPYLTIPRAQQAVRALPLPWTSDAVVYLRGGLYPLQSTVSFTIADSGQSGFTARWEAYPSDASPVVIHGGAAVPGASWAQVGSTPVWSAPLPAGVTDARQVYINGDRMNATNTGSGLPGSVTITSWGYTTTDPLAWASDVHQAAQDVEFLYTGVGSSWTECRLRVASIAPLAGGAGTNITMQEPGFSLGRNRYFGQELTAPASIANAYALLATSAPGSYYVNSATHTLYYVPRPEDDLATAFVVVPALNGPLLQLTGQRDAQPLPLPVSYATWLDPNVGLGYVDMQSGFRVLPSSTEDDDTWTPVPANIVLQNVHNASFSNLTFTHLGATAISADEGSQSLVFLNNTFRDISCGGIMLGQLDDVNRTDPLRMNAHFLVEDNFFDGIPNEFHDCAAITLGFTVNASLQHNAILNNANTGISVGWGWSRDEALNCGYNNISFNYVMGSNWLLEDGGSIYTVRVPGRGVDRRDGGAAARTDLTLDSRTYYSTPPLLPSPAARPPARHRGDAQLRLGPEEALRRSLHGRGLCFHRDRLQRGQQLARVAPYLDAQHS